MTEQEIQAKFAKMRKHYDDNKAIVDSEKTAFELQTAGMTIWEKLRFQYEQNKNKPSSGNDELANGRGRDQRLER